VPIVYTTPFQIPYFAGKGLGQYEAETRAFEQSMQRARLELEKKRLELERERMKRQFELEQQQLRQREQALQEQKTFREPRETQGIIHPPVVIRGPGDWTAKITEQQKAFLEHFGRSPEQLREKAFQEEQKRQAQLQAEQLRLEELKIMAAIEKQKQEEATRIKEIERRREEEIAKVQRAKEREFKEKLYYDPYTTGRYVPFEQRGEIPTAKEIAGEEIKRARYIETMRKQGWKPIEEIKIPEREFMGQYGITWAKETKEAVPRIGMRDQFSADIEEAERKIGEYQAAYVAKRITKEEKDQAIKTIQHRLSAKWSEAKYQVFIKKLKPGWF
jgi:hypothetical protein